jgi:archaellum component FlaD/FlaE
MREAITDSEKFTLVRLVKAGVPWEKVRKALLPEVDPAALDANWKDWVFDRAGKEAEQDEVVAVQEKAKADELAAAAQAKIDAAKAAKEAAKAVKEAAKAARLAAEEAELERLTAPPTDPLE